MQHLSGRHPHRLPFALSGFTLNHSVRALLVQNAVSAFSASNDVSLLQLIFMAAVPTDVGHALIGNELLLLLGWQHRSQDFQQLAVSVC